MAQLPPKVPSITPSWPQFGPKKSLRIGGGGRPSSWANEFLDFSAAKRGAHRRSVSKSVAFLEECGGGGCGGDAEEFDSFDDDQLMSMFSDEAAPVVSSPSATGAPSDRGSTNGKKSEEAQSACEAAAAPPAGPPPQQEPAGEKTVDPKRVKRILANRQSAQRSRVRKLQYISELERSVTTLQTEVSALSPRVAFLDHQRSLLAVGNSHLKQRIAALAQDNIFKDAHQEELKKELERLRRVYYQQKLKKMDASDFDASIHLEKELLNSEATACALTPPS